MKSPLWIEFANSLAHDPVGHAPPTDHMDEPAWALKLAQRFGLPRFDARDEAVLTELRRLRTLLHEAASSLAANGRATPAQLKTLNEYLAAKPVVCRLDESGDGEEQPALTPYRLRLDATAEGLEAVLFQIAASLAEFLAEADPTRIRLCENPDCRWVFYDETRSRTRRWCADSCGNLMKVRRFRAKRKKFDELDSP